MPKYGYKLVLVENYVEECAYLDGFCMFRPIGAIIKIEIPDDAITISYIKDITKKRCSKCIFVRVEGYYRIAAYNFLFNKLYKDNRIYAKDLYKMIKSKKNLSVNKTEPIKFISMYDNNFIYEKGKDIYPKLFYQANDVECIDGIHYFDHMYEVQNYYNCLLQNFVADCISL